jgi:hypothetical protein
LIIDAKLDDIAILDGVGTTEGASGTQPDMIQKGTATTFSVFDEEASSFYPNFSVCAGDDF